ncbi:MAG: lipocalin family protein [Marinifilaceae bacterium]|jgi:hypothetical protein|nr:lipocalin family protein [Marinifilaceae bacterium]
MKKTLRFSKFGKLSLVAAVAFSSLFVSCSDDDDDTVDMTKVNLLTKSPWYQQGSVTKAGGESTTDDLTDCELDDEYNFKDNYTYEFTNGKIVCDDDDLNSESTGTWKFTSNNTKIEGKSKSGEKSQFEIVSLTETELKLKIETSFLGQKFEIITTYAHSIKGEVKPSDSEVAKKLTSGTWYIIKEEETIDGDTQNILKSHMFDDEYILSADGNYSLTDGKIKDENDKTRADNGVWSLSDNDTKLTMTSKTTGETVLEIISLTETECKLRTTITLESGKQAIFNMTLNKTPLQVV